MAVKVKTDLRSPEGLTVYSDPSGGNLYMKVVTSESGPGELSILNDKSQVLSKLSVPVNQLTYVPLNNLMPGLYIAEVKLKYAVLKENFRI